MNPELKEEREYVRSVYTVCNIVHHAYSKDRVACYHTYRYHVWHNRLCVRPFERTRKQAKVKHIEEKYYVVE